jgi:1-acyl-sn-glycerol-3-phosphate acyltransferase
MKTVISVLAWLRSFVAVLTLFPLLTLFCSLVTLLCFWLPGRNRIFNALASLWGFGTCWMFGVRIKFIDADLRPSGGFLYLFNHTSFFDIFALQAGDNKMRFGAKIELFKIPLFGPAMRGMGVLPITRADVQEVARVYQEAAPMMRAGRRFALAPEGKRNTSSEKLLKFKSGPFLFALAAQVPVVPVVIIGADRLWHKGRLVPSAETFFSEVQVRFLPAMSPLSNDKSAKLDLQERVHSVMLAALEESRVPESSAVH